MKGKMRPKAQDVADLAGVSRTTVSFVLNDRDQAIPEATRRRVLNAAKKLGYVPSAAARSLRNGVNNVVLMLTPNDAPSEAGDEMWSKLSETLDGKGLTCILSRSAGSTTALSHVLAEVRPCMVVAFFVLEDEDRVMLERLDIPLLELWDGSNDSERRVSYKTLQYCIGAVQAEYLISQGCRRLAYVGEREARVNDIQHWRYEGAMATVARYPNASLIGLVNFGIYTSSEDWRDWEGLPADCDAVCAFNDTIAAAVLAWAKKRGISVPDTLRVLGADNSRVNDFLDPPLSSVGIDDHATWSNGVIEAILAKLGRYEAGDVKDVVSDVQNGEGDASGVSDMICKFGIHVVPRASA